jgi:hypothetical protein
MNPAAPQIGFDRFIALDWADAALRARAGMGTIEDLDALLDSAGLGVAARKKTRTVLNRLWLQPRSELADFATRGVALFKHDGSVPVAALSWGMSIAAYPFFGAVAELVGRLSALQGDCASAEIHRRMSERYGEREGTYRMTNMVLQSQASWGAIERSEGGKRIVRLKPSTIADERTVAWLLEAALRFTGKPVSVSTLASQAVLYPLVLDQPLGYLASRSPHLVTGSRGPNHQFVAVHSGG